MAGSRRHIEYQWDPIDGGKHHDTLTKFHNLFAHHDTLNKAHNFNTRAAYGTGDNIYGLLSTAIPHYKSHDPLIRTPTSVEDYNTMHNELKLNNSSSHAFKKLDKAHINFSINSQRKKLIGPNGETIIENRKPIKRSQNE